jgi:hypothetical protein
VFTLPLWLPQTFRDIFDHMHWVINVQMPTYSEN